MLQLKTRHLLTGTELSAAETVALIDFAIELKKNRNHHDQWHHLLQHKHLALLFDKPSLRTRMSFTIAMRELGGDVIESASTTRKREEPEDQARVLAGYCHAVMLRTYKDEDLARMAKASQIPVINGLSDKHHPCQILADLMTLKERFNKLSGLTVAYIGDGNNVLHSLILIAPALGINIHYCCPDAHGPNADIVNQAIAKNHSGKIKAFATPVSAVAGANAVYTDVWTSMGFAEKKENLFAGFQVNEALMAHAEKDAIFLHCMPMNRGKEVSASLPDLPCSAIYQQSENRLHVQKALLIALMTPGENKNATI